MSTPKELDLEARLDRAEAAVRRQKEVLEALGTTASNLERQYENAKATAVFLRGALMRTEGVLQGYIEGGIPGVGWTSRSEAAMRELLSIVQPAWLRDSESAKFEKEIQDLREALFKARRELAHISVNIPEA